jgi:hypothetical protein
LERLIASESSQMSYRYTLRTPDGDDVGEIELHQPATPGEEVRVTGLRRMLIQAVVPTERIEDSLGGASIGFQVVEPVE